MPGRKDYSLKPMKTPTEIQVESTPSPTVRFRHSSTTDQAKSQHQSGLPAGILQGESLWHDTAPLDRSDVGGEAKASRVQSYSHQRKINPGKKVPLHFPLQGKVCTPSLSTARRNAGERWKHGVSRDPRISWLPQSHLNSKEKNEAHGMAVMNEGGNSAAKDNFANRYY